LKSHILILTGTGIVSVSSRIHQCGRDFIPKSLMSCQISPDPDAAGEWLMSNRRVNI
jgi:hypothetical protein